MGTYAPRLRERHSRWFLVDAEGENLGRLATLVATRLRGKHRPDFTPHFDHGDHVVVINASKVVLTGNKLQRKIYRRHSGYPGGLKEITAGKLMASHPDRLIRNAVSGMLPKNPLGRKLIGHLKIYAGSTHPHAAQNPESLSVRTTRAALTQTSAGR
ncbi:MAG: 50S ribosomal protein L13 [Acidobacteriota bacterium]